MMKNLFKRFGSLTLCTVFTVIGMNTVSQRLPDDLGREAWHLSRALAQTAEEQIARQVYQKASPAVVTVKTGSGHGSGFVVSQDGLIITNAHVIKPRPQTQEELETYNPNDFPNVVTVVFPDGRQVSADVLGFALGGLDLAALKIFGQKNLSIIALASGGTAKVGDRIFALGSPLEAEFKDTFTQGNITRIEPSHGSIQHDAVIMPGNSGGPLLNTQAQVIGVNRYIISASGMNAGMNFAIPVSQLQSFITAVRQKNVSPISTLVQPTKEPSIPTISLNGQVVNGSLAEGDDNPTGKFADLYQFQGRAGQQVVIEMTSQKINSVLTLYQVIESDEGQKLKPVAENDDRGPGDFNARILSSLPANGVYLIEAISLERGETGDYSLRATTNR